MRIFFERIEFKIVGEKLEGTSISVKTDNNKIADIKDGTLNYNRLNPNLSFENFVVGKSNNLAFLSAKKIISSIED